jgi:hypothetical protein
VQWPFCHSWLNHVKRSVPAMFMILALAALAVFATVSSVVALRNDGYRRTPTDWTRLP